MDERNLELRESYKKYSYNTDRLAKSMEEDNWDDKLYIVYRNDSYNNRFYLFDSGYKIGSWLEKKWKDWDLWEHGNPNEFFEENLVIWEFHRNVCIEKWPTLYDESKTVLDGWSRKREYVQFEMQPSFLIG